MLYRKIQRRLEEYFTAGSNKILLIDGARQIGKSFIIRYMGQKHFKNYIEVNLWEDSLNSRLFADVKNVDDFYLRLSMFARNKLKIRKIYDMIPSMMENKKKRIVANKIESKKGARLSNYQDEFEYLTNAGVALEVSAITDVKFPLIESSTKNLLKLYLNDVGILTGVLYGSNISAVLNDVHSINLGAVYETVVAQELKAHGKKLFYYDNRHKGEVDFLIDDFDSLSVVPIEVKSGRDYRIHSAIDNLLKTNENAKGIVLSNSSKVMQKGAVLYLPIYFTMFL